MMDQEQDTYYQSLTIQQRQHYDRQELLLKAYAKLGKIYRAADACGIPIGTIDSWQYRDTHGFNKRMEQAHRQYVESLEAEMDATIKSRPVATQVLQIFRLKAEWPEKYREEVKVLGLDQSKLMLDKLRGMAAKDLAQQAALEAPAVEGVYREVDKPKPEEVWTPPPPAEAPPPEPPRESVKDQRAAQFRASRAARARTPGRITRR
jgi:hypothetical protein